MPISGKDDLRETIPLHANRDLGNGLEQKLLKRLYAKKSKKDKNK